MGKDSPFKNIPILGWLLQLFIGRRDVYKSEMLCLCSLSLTFIVEEYLAVQVEKGVSEIFKC